MSIQETERRDNFKSEYAALTKNAASATSGLVKAVAELRVLIPYMHENIRYERGDMKEGDRLKIRDALVPLFPQLQQALVDATEVFDIYKDDPEEWAVAIAAFYEKYPTLFDEADARFEKLL